ncbi:Putative pterin-4-alpha-carbinolamine dehydratase [Galdieria sulphuraria]|uniref:4a-hydroxytetrahydrobiopterin dehydratase n=1 Tax=Galdieria sulphuraria TaxID=130081 RepID=M2W249_GALSU|nr:4a-hydroxytetrahydrobiopterin dehydratase [Galdieria sulphuraria]EME29766.1 4a-hydroxytetrahydrobiopterin dehydratase [Galdieria sulphuraria]GJD06751.1 Putative pterin-4-alpha-carbinolamine dehydratase [Galdieria sulphuraria]|eukprot:XP_005706286.1 4a-hydroxytetrahydrobiopterin dehydratase [Galdieria sulphuraria]
MYGRLLQQAFLQSRKYFSTEISSKSRCLPCEGIGKTLEREQVQQLLDKVQGWKVSPDNKQIFKNLELPDFMSAIRYFQQIADVAEAEGHHPDLHLTGYNKVRIDLSTHALKGLTENDFIMAMKIDSLGR